MRRWQMRTETRRQSRRQWVPLLLLVQPALGRLLLGLERMAWWQGQAGPRVPLEHWAQRRRQSRQRLRTHLAWVRGKVWAMGPPPRTAVARP